MKLLVSAFAVALTMSTGIVLAQSNDNVPVPSAQNSGAGIAGSPGNKNGPAAQPGTVGSSATTDQTNPAVKEQDPAKIQGLPGNKSGPAVKPPSH